MDTVDTLPLSAAIDTQRQQAAREYAKIRQRLLLFGLLLSALILGLWGFSGASAGLAGALATQKWPWTVQIAAYVILFGLVYGILSLPLLAYQGYVLPHRYGLSTQSRWDWMLDMVKGILVGALVVLGAAEVVYTLLRAAPETWWLWTGVIYLLFTVVLSNLAPVLLMPLFFTFTPLQDAKLVECLTRLAEQAGTHVNGVYCMNLSSKTTATNAALVGLGNTRRIVLADTLLAHYTPDEIEVILAHELAHHVHRDIPLFIGIDAILTLLGLYLANLALHAGTRALGYAGIADLRAFPFFLFIMGLFAVITMPLGNTFSRWRERMADAYAVRSTGKRLAFISAMTRLANQNLSELQPERWVEVLLYSHPPIARRIAMAEQMS